MAELRSIFDFKESAWQGGDIIHTLTELGRFFIFSYAPDAQAMIAWSDNAKDILGVPDSCLMSHGNVFLRHVHADDRFVVMSKLENCITQRSVYEATYRWIRPDDNRLVWLHARATSIWRNEQRLVEGLIMEAPTPFCEDHGPTANPSVPRVFLQGFDEFVLILDTDFRVTLTHLPPNFESCILGDPNFDTTALEPGQLFLNGFHDPHLKQRLSRIFKELLQHDRQLDPERYTLNGKCYEFTLHRLSETSIVCGFLVKIANVSSNWLLEQHLRRLQQSENLRLLASDAAENIHNSLQSIRSQAEVISLNTDNPAFVQRCAHSIIGLVARLREFSRHLMNSDEVHDQIPTPVDLDAAVIAAISVSNTLLETGDRPSVIFGRPAPVLASRHKLISIIRDLLEALKETELQLTQLTILTRSTNLAAQLVIILPNLSISDSKHTKILALLTEITHSLQPQSTAIGAILKQESVPSGEQLVLSLPLAGSPQPSTEAQN